MKKQKILVTGAAGFIGSHLCDGLIEKKFDTYSVDDLSGGYLRNISQKKKFTKLDLRNRKKVKDYINKLKPEVIFHLAADATEGRSQFTPFSAVDRNLVAYLNVLIPAIKNGLKKVILVSSMSVYGAQQVPFDESMNPRPEDIYGVSKASMEEVTKVLSKVYGFKYVIIRPHNVYGPKQNLADPYRNVIGIFINRLMQGKNFFIYGDGNQRRAFSYIDDVVPPMIKAAFTKKAENMIFNLGSDEAVTLNHVSAAILESFFGNNKIQNKFKPTYVPDRPQEVKDAFCDHKNAREILGFKASVRLDVGISKMVSWAKSVGPQKFKYLSELDLENKSTPSTWKKKTI